MMRTRQWVLFSLIFLFLKTSIKMKIFVFFQPQKFFLLKTPLAFFINCISPIRPFFLFLTRQKVAFSVCSIWTDSLRASLFYHFAYTFLLIFNSVNFMGKSRKSKGYFSKEQKFLGKAYWEVSFSPDLSKRKKKVSNKKSILHRILAKIRFLLTGK